MNNMEKVRRPNLKLLEFETQPSFYEKPDETVNGIKVKYQLGFYESTGDLGIPLSIFKTNYEKDFYVVLDEVFRDAPLEIKKAAVEHEKIHEKYPCFIDRYDEIIGLVVNTIAFVESQNPICAGMLYICQEIRRIKDSEKTGS